MGRRATGETFIARIRIPKDRWDALEDAVGLGHRARLVNELVQMFLDDVELWQKARAIASKRGESIGKVVNDALTRYVARHRDLLDEATTPPS
jgi:hypothetical protein